ncbi:hypothetical protein scyTo_0018812 [Scyliorhinus torazame]|uniref:Uncharacterized protein n=1 Tax=Scyliorhinus torazame TaxID=75743 RepID=A0A401Q342_SCYTO|nr:hypothetical protein [Scyliorhinus torazame]
MFTMRLAKRNNVSPVVTPPGCPASCITIEKSDDITLAVFSVSCQIHWGDSDLSEKKDHSIGLGACSLSGMCGNPLPPLVRRSAADRESNIDRAIHCNFIHVSELFNPITMFQTLNLYFFLLAVITKVTMAQEKTYPIIDVGNECRIKTGNIFSGCPAGWQEEKEWNVDNKPVAILVLLSSKIITVSLIDIQELVSPFENLTTVSPESHTPTSKAEHMHIGIGISIVIVVLVVICCAFYQLKGSAGESS